MTKCTGTFLYYLIDIPSYYFYCSREIAWLYHYSYLLINRIARRADADLDHSELDNIELVSPVIHARFDNYFDDDAEFILLEHSGTSRLKEQTNFWPKPGYHQIIARDFAVDEEMKFEICEFDDC